MIYLSENLFSSMCIALALFRTQGLISGGAKGSAAPLLFKHISKIKIFGWIDFLNKLESL